jgi:hypothetical protein
VSGKPTDVRSLAEASRDFFVALETGQPVTCPCCQRTTQVYTRKLHREIAINLVRLVDRHELRPGEWCQVRDFVAGSAKATKASTDLAFLVHWGLIERKGRGLYRPTRAGIDFARGRTRVAAAVQTYDNECIGRSERTVSIHDLIGREPAALL